MAICDLQEKGLEKECSNDKCVFYFYCSKEYLKYV